jgi:phage-related minor tail protein
MKVTFIILFCFLGYGCAAKKLAVQNADSLITHQMTKRLPLYSDQKDTLEKDVDAFLDRTKPMAQEVLPVIDEMNLKNEEEISTQYQKLESFFVQVSNEFSKLSSKYMAKLDPKQQKEFFETLDDENREILKKEKENRIDQAENRLELFLGHVNSKQKQIIREYGDYLQKRAKTRLDRRIKLHHEFKIIYHQDISESSRASAFLEQFVNYQNESMTGNKNLEIIKRFIPTITSEQREHFRKEAEEIKSLIKYFNSVEY